MSSSSMEAFFPVKQLLPCCVPTSSAAPMKYLSGIDIPRHTHWPLFWAGLPSFLGGQIFQNMDHFGTRHIYIYIHTVLWCNVKACFYNSLMTHPLLFSVQSNCTSKGCMMQTLQQLNEHLCGFHAPSGQSAWSPRPDIANGCKVASPPFDQRVTYHNSVFLWFLFFKNHRIRNFFWTFELPMAATHTRVKKLQPVRMSKWSYKQIKIYLDPSKVYLKCLLFWLSIHRYLSRFIDTPWKVLVPWARAPFRRRQHQRKTRSLQSLEGTNNKTMLRIAQIHRI